MGQQRDRLQCLLVDYGIYWDCNIACSYCRSEPVRSGNSSTQQDNQLNIYLEGLERVTKHVDAPMFKTSGWGEITRLRGYNTLFIKASELGYSVLQLITNGVTAFSIDTLSDLKRLGYFSVQFSLDGLTIAENRYRFGLNQNLLNQALRNIELTLSLSIPVEINTVLTDLNTAHLRPFLVELLKMQQRYKTALVCVPRRVRIKRTLQNHRQVPSTSDVDQFASVFIGEFDQFSNVLPPKEYLNRLVFNLQSGQRNWTTYDALIRVNIGASRDVVVHTTNGNRDLGKIDADDAAESFARRIGYHSATGERDYQTKMTQFDVHYLYLGGLISLTELSRIPSCNNPPAHERLRYLRSLVVRSRTVSRQEVNQAPR